VLVGGFVVDQLATITVVVLLGALVALALAAYCDLRRVGVS